MAQPLIDDEDLRPGTVRGLSYAERLAGKYNDQGTAGQMREFQREDSVTDQARQRARYRPPKAKPDGVAAKLGRAYDRAQTMAKALE